MNKNSRLVYSTNIGRIKKTEPLSTHVPSDGIVRLQRETKGRKGKGVVIVTGLPLTHTELLSLAKKLKQHCGTGGAVKNNTLEIQGDHREKIKRFLEQLEFTVKLAGG